MLSGGEIKKLRQNKEMTQEDLAAVMDVGIASIKRWETGAIQSRSMDQTLRRQLSEGPAFDTITGNRKFSIPLILRVALAFKEALGRAILKEDDRMVYDAAHKESAWLETSNGDLIPYHWADRVVAWLRHNLWNPFLCAGIKVTREPGYPILSFGVVRQVAIFRGRRPDYMFW